MRLSFGMCALAAYGSATSAQLPQTQAAASRSQTTPARQQADSLRLTRRQAIAEALVRNAQLEIAREQTAQARARRQTAIAVPDPVVEAGFDQETAPFRTGGAKPVSIGVSIPFPDKFRLNNRIGLADIGAFESNYRLQRQTVSLQASAAYDSLLRSEERRGGEGWHNRKGTAES